MAALAGIRVLEFAGLAPCPFAGMILADFGAVVTRIDRVKTLSFIGVDPLARGKKSICIDLKNPRGKEIVRKLCLKSDVLIEPFRPGVMETLGLGPEILLKDNPRLIYARLTGYGQTGTHSQRAGHDINYIALSGLLSKLGRKDEKPTPPINLLADFAGGGLTCVLGVLLALFERSKSGKGQVVDVSMVEGSAYIGSFIYKTLSGLEFAWPNPKERGTNLLDTGAPFYDTYKTSDGKFMAVGALEPKFYKQFLKGLDLEGKLPHQADLYQWPKAKEEIASIFSTKTQSDWCKIFENLDACVEPVLTTDEAPLHPHNQERNAFSFSHGAYEPTPAPKLSRTPADCLPKPLPGTGEHTVEILQHTGYSQSDIQELIDEGVVECPNMKSSL